jgi:hypothetical protein
VPSVDLVGQDDSSVVPLMRDGVYV